MNFNAEIIEKAKVAKTAEELYEIAKANNIEMTADEAATYFAQLNSKNGELSDDDLDNVAGGACEKYDGNTDVGKTVRVIGDSCSKCGGTTGTLEWSEYFHTLRIKCNTCKQMYGNTPSYEVL